MRSFLKNMIFILLFSLAVFITGIIDISAEEYSDLFKKISSDGNWNVTVYKKPTTCEEVDLLMTSVANEYIKSNDYYVSAFCTDWSSNDVNKVTVSISSTDGEFVENHNLNVNYNIANNNKTKIVESVVSKIKNMTDEEILDHNNGYELSDLNLINYLNIVDKVEFYEPNSASKAFSFTKDIINITKGSNIYYSADVRAGYSFDSAALWQSSLGSIVVFYNGIAYTSLRTGIIERNILYVDENATDYAKYAQERIRKYLKNDSVTVVKGGTLDSLSYQECNNMNYVTNTCENYRTVTYNSENIFDESKLVDDNYYVVSINNNTYNFVLYKGTNEQLSLTPSYISTDIESKISIESDETSIPLDTLVTAKVVNDEKIKDQIGTDLYEAYDINLYSFSQNKKITKLENGKFLVSIPVPEKLNNKTLTVFYINELQEKEEHEVTVKDGYASFETNHFSTYILTEKKSDNSSVVESEKVPDTYDSIMMNILICLLSFTGLLFISYNINKQYK